MAERVRITDVSPRDGLQNEAGVIPTAEKVCLIELLCATGVDEVEVTSFVSAKWVPQLGDAREVFEGIAGFAPLPGGEGQGVGFASPGGRFKSPRAESRRGEVYRRGPIEYTVPPRDRAAYARASTLRRTSTGPEEHVWSILRGKQIGGFKFRRQHPFGPYILDFFCAEFGLAIELDGRTHAGADARGQDALRTGFLESHGLTVARFTNDQVLAGGPGLATTVQRLCERLYREGNKRGLAHAKPHPRPLPSGEGRTRQPVLSVLVPNERGMQSALEVQGVGRLIGKVSVFTAASETFAQRNTNASIAETLERFKPVLGSAQENGLPVRGYISCAVACPFEGAVAPAKVADVAARLVRLGVDEIDLGDTIGAGTPETVGAMLDAVRRTLGRDWWGAEKMTLHLHDTFGRAAACVEAALTIGVRSFDGSVAGLGGCPYASTPGKRAPGNIATETLVETVEKAGYATGVNRERLAEAAAYAREIVARSRRPESGT
ncbi:MAG TPA: DUF559 domain-containing protein [Phycisphaerales bacterium]|nr:DUF559 domain-containing protein [Phycisphaerales bacterium]